MAFDGLSRYDLTRYNPWYFGRLHQFASLCDQKGLVLIDQMFFQHHVLEDVAHWMDVPWRVTNALQDVVYRSHRQPRIASGFSSPTFTTM